MCHFPHLACLVDVFVRIDGPRDAEVLSDRRDNLTREEFVARATFDADFAECFGLFDYFYRKIIQPIEHRVRIILLCLSGVYTLSKAKNISTFSEMS